MKITCVCGMGMGSSLIAKMNIERILAEEGIEAQVDNSDVGSVSSGSDWYVITNELVESMPQAARDKMIVLTNFINVDAIRAVLLDHLA